MDEVLKAVRCTAANSRTPAGFTPIRHLADDVGWKAITRLIDGYPPRR